ncbi:MAG: polysaccharide deacetylase family protein, partial [Flavobacteriales bacterium]|nr:polysaccharide deacetylase family protein [Flavobacteriales bacterium]
PFFLRWIYSEATWRVNTSEKILYLTFDDGPTEEVTDFVLEELKKYNAKATFFCLGLRALNNPFLMNALFVDGHGIGNHSFSHPNGFRTKIGDYLDDVKKADDVIASNLFRPPYGKMKWRQYKKLKEFYKIVMWDVMSGDFDKAIDGNRCFKNVTDNAKEGSIVIFHDSEQAFPRLKVALPKVLKYYSDLGYRFEKLVLPAPIDIGVMEQSSP